MLVCLMSKPLSTPGCTAEDCKAASEALSDGWWWLVLCGGALVLSVCLAVFVCGDCSKSEKPPARHGNGRESNSHRDAVRKKSGSSDPMSSAGFPGGAVAAPSGVAVTCGGGVAVTCGGSGCCGCGGGCGGSGDC